MSKKLNASQIKVNNRRMIYQYIREQGSVSKQDIVVGLGLSLPTVTQNLQYLEEQGLIDASKKIKNTGGRNATAYTYLPNAKAAIGVYLSRHHMSGVAVNLSGEEICTERKRIQFNLEDDNYLRELGSLVEDIKQDAGISDENLLGVGLGVQSLVSDDGEEVIYGLTLNFTGKRREEIAKYIPYKNRLYHDSLAAGYSEVWRRADLQNAFYLSLSNSVGGCIIIDGEIYMGDGQKSGEVGHMIMEPRNGKTCYCGRKGCMDTVCNAGLLDSYTNGNLEEFFRVLKEGDQEAARIWDEYLDYLAVAVSNIRVLYDCAIILGGYVGPYLEDYMDDLCTRVNGRYPFDDRAEDYVTSCKYKMEATAAGSAIFYVENFLDNI